MGEWMCCLVLNAKWSERTVAKYCTDINIFNDISSTLKKINTNLKPIYQMIIIN